MPVKAHRVSFAGSHRRTVLLWIRKPRDLSAAKASADSGHLSKITSFEASEQRYWLRSDHETQRPSVRSGRE